MHKIIRQINKIIGKSGYYSTPDFIIMGAQKAGTTGLQKTLNQHSRVTSSHKKEISYFSNDDLYSKGNLLDYHAYFPLPFQVHADTLLFEATPIYLFHPKVPERLFNYNPHLKLIVVLRDPTMRAFSAWTMYHHHFKTGEYSHLYDPRSFSEVIETEIANIDKTQFEEDKIAYVKRGIYHAQIKELFKNFPSDQICIIESRELLDVNGDALRKIQSFLQVPFENIVSKKQNESKIDERDKYSKELQRLRTFYTPHNIKLYELIGKNFEW